jgi:excinuclease ABC subunit B
VEGKVIMYADHVTDSMRTAIDETNRRRQIQQAYNEQHNIEPASIIKQVRDLTDRVRAEAKTAADAGEALTPEQLPVDELKHLIKELEREMKQAAKALEFEKAAALRDQIIELRGVAVLKQANAEDDIPAFERLQRTAQAQN